MTDKDTKDVAKVSSRELLKRSDVPAGLKYRDYIEWLRPDFFFSCAYCTISESEAAAVRFTIDHYEPQRPRPDLANDYNNLMYCCDPCNIYKGPRMPSEEMRKKGYRFFRPDEHYYAEHFEKNGQLLDAKSKVGEFTIASVDLNRKMLRRLRELRERASNCDEFVLGGLRKLRDFSIDQLPQHLKGRAATAIADTNRLGGGIIKNIDEVLRAVARR
jgi:hypothetical protein